MKRIDSLHVVQTRIFRIDEIQLSEICLNESIKRIQKQFLFKQAIPLQPPLSADPQGALAFTAGEVKDKDRAYEIDRLIL